MKRIISKFFLVLAVPFLKVSNYFSPNKVNKNTPQHKRVLGWYQAKGDETLRLDYNLSFDSIVFDVGGYEGVWAGDIFCKYGCHIYIFEPVQSYYLQIQKKFSSNNRVHPFCYGLSGENEKLNIGILKDASSTFKSDETGGTLIELRSIAEFITENNISKIDLIKINIEGGEYSLLESLIELRMIERIGNLQIQFHDFVPNAQERMKKIQEGLSMTHELTYQFEFVWENWKRK